MPVHPVFDIGSRDRHFDPVALCQWIGRYSQKSVKGRRLGRLWSWSAGAEGLFEVLAYDQRPRRALPLQSRTSAHDRLWVWIGSRASVMGKVYFK